MFKKLFSSTLVFLFVISATAFAQPKIGYMNTQEVISNVPERSDIQEELNSFIQQKRQELEQQTAAFQDSVAEYQQNKSALSEQEAADAENRLSQMQSSMQQFRQAIQQQIQRRRTELLQPLYNRMNEAIASVAEEKNLDFVLNEATNSGEKLVYYSAKQKLDITDEVLEQMKATSAKN
ncbi:OmpH family outer membrane protein [Fodinibius halophilus]|uniref:OmpH family outer membrane protein n=1 Tax=Fodinibius halophilus TaxID=1736908 RepID=A0A6M1T5I6_9BACT|nr:OmpH family outer membrane protein [Fodinibius halophilus]NGP89319.1 OmpH family outer membrane protein [Fodinibius halophilus]